MTHHKLSQLELYETHKIGSSDTKYVLNSGIALDINLIDGLIMDMIQNNEISTYSLVEDDYTYLIQMIKHALKMNTIILTCKNVEILIAAQNLNDLYILIGVK